MPQNIFPSKASRELTLENSCREGLHWWHVHARCAITEGHDAELLALAAGANKRAAASLGDACVNLKLYVGDTRRARARAHIHKHTTQHKIACTSTPHLRGQRANLIRIRERGSLKREVAMARAGA